MLKVVFQIKIDDAWIPNKICKAKVKPVIVIGIDQGEVWEQLIWKQMIPAEVCYRIAVGVVKQIGNVKDISSKIPRKEKVVFGV